MHAAPTIISRIRGWPRKTKIAAATGALLLVGVIVAVALTLIRADINGEANVPQEVPEVEWVSAGLATTTTANCDLNVVSGDLEIIMSAETLDQHCDVLGTVRTVGETNVTWLVQNLIFTDATDETFAALGSTPIACGKAITPSGLDVAFTLHYTPGAAPGSHPAATDAGLVAVNDGDFVAADCPNNG